jgi:hypothetical protein
MTAAASKPVFVKKPGGAGMCCVLLVVKTLFRTGITVQASTSQTNVFRSVFIDKGFLGCGMESELKKSPILS